MKTNSHRIPSPGLVGLAVFAALLIAALNADGGGGGADWYLLSPEGKLIRKLSWKERDTVDTAAGLVYRLNNEVLDAFGFEDELKRWSLRCPAPTPRDGTLVLGADQTLAILANGILHGYDKRTGQALYRTPLGTPLHKFELPKNYRPHFSWGIKANGEEGRFFYLTQERIESVMRAGRWAEPVALQAPALAKFDLLTGSEVWETVFATNIVVDSVSPGVLESQIHRVHFDPETGRLLTNISPAQVLYAGGTGFCLSTGQTTTLTAIETGTQRILWKLEGLTGVRRILAPYAHERLLCATDSRVKIVNTAKRRVQAEFPVAGLNYYAHFLQTKRVVIAQSNLERRAVNPDTGDTLWQKDSRHVGFPALARDGDDTVVTVESDRRRKERNELFEVVALGIETGAPGWRWQVPDGPWGDSVGVYVERCPGGFAVCRGWYVGE